MLKLPLQITSAFVPKPAVVPTVAKPKEVVAEEDFNGPIVGEVNWTRRDGTSSDEPPAPPKPDPRIPRPHWTPEDPKWIERPSAKLEAYRANLSSVRLARLTCSVEGRSVGVNREPSSNGSLSSTRDGETLWIFRKRPRLDEGAKGERLDVGGRGDGVVREPSSKEPRPSSRARKESPREEDAALTPEFEVGSPLALMFEFLGDDSMVGISSFFCKCWLSKSPEMKTLTKTPWHPCEERACLTKR